MGKLGQVLLISLILGLQTQQSWAIDLDLKDLGVKPLDPQEGVALQSILEQRRFNLEQHQVWGLVAAGSMALAVFSGGEGDLPPEHPLFAGIAVGAYAAAAYYAWNAPEVNAGPPRGQIQWHKYLVWIHAPGMVLTPIAGYIAAKQIEKGERLSGLGEQHKNIAGATAVALALSAISVSFEF